MERQAKYDKGVQKIQGQIDNVAGMDIMKGDHKVYLESQLNKLGSDLRTVAASDFSNFQLVNSVGGMATQIIKDPTIQAAVSSTAHYKKQAAEIAVARKAGKSDPSNEAKFNKQFSAYMSDPKIGSSFNSSYVPFVDVWGKLVKVAEAVGIDQQDIKKLFKTDEQGNPIRLVGKKGEDLGFDYNPIMSQEILKGKDPAKILSAFQAALTPADYQQLAITGEYLRSGSTPEMLKQEITKNFTQQIEFASGKSEALKIAIYKEQQKPVKDNDKITSLTQQLDYFNKSTDTLKSSLDKDLANVDSNPDGVRASLYTNEFLHTNAKTLSSSERSTNYSVNPMHTVTMDLNRLKRDVERDRISDQHWAIEQENRKIDKDEESRRWVYEMSKKYPTTIVGDGDGYIKMPLNIGDNPAVIKNQVVDNYSSGVVALNNVNSKITEQFIKNANPIKPGESQEQYTERTRKIIYDFATGNKESVDVGSGDINSFTQRFANKQLEEWKKHPDNIPVEFRGLIAQQDALTKDLSIQQGRMQETKNQAIAIGKERGLTIPTDDEIKKNIKPARVVVQLPGGMGQKGIDISKEDITDWVASTPEAFNTFGRIFSSKEETNSAEQATKRLKLKYGKDFDAVWSSLFRVNTALAPSAGGIARTIPFNQSIIDAHKYLASSNYNKLAAIESELYVKSGMVKQALAAPILVEKDKVADRNARISTIFSKYKGSLNETPGYEEEDMQKALLSDANNAVIGIVRPGVGSSPNTYEIQVNSADGKSRSATVDADDYKFVTGKTFQNNPTPKVVEQINYKGTSNLAGSSDPASSWFHAGDFKNLKGVNYTLTADLVPDQSNPNSLFLKMTQHFPDGSTNPITYPDPFSKFNPDGSLDQKLDYLPLGINSTVIQQLKSKK